eukprot:69514-Rhodomonas_salina.1
MCMPVLTVDGAQAQAGPHCHGMHWHPIMPRMADPEGLGTHDQGSLRNGGPLMRGAPADRIRMSCSARN